MRHLHCLLASLLLCSVVFAQADSYKDLLGQGRELDKAKDYAGAEAKFEAAYNAATTPRDKGTALLMSLYSVRRMPDSTDKAMDICKRILAIDGVLDQHYSSAKAFIAQTLLTQKKVDEAKAAFEEAIADPRVTKADRESSMMYLGHLERDRQNFDAARAAYSKLLGEEVTPVTRIYAQSGIANTYYREKNYEQAIAEYNKALELPDVKPSRKAGLYSELGSTYIAMKKYPEAREALEKCIAAPDVVPAVIASARARIASTYISEKNTEEGRKILQQIIDDPATPDAGRQSAQKSLERLK